MKKKYILIPLICVIILIAIIVTVAVSMRTGYLEKLPYDHIGSTVYNGVEIVGDDGLFYLVKDGKKLSDGYASLKSVNDYYENIKELTEKGKQVTLFDYYIARTAENSDYMLISSDGDKAIISGDSYSLDEESTCLPYLVFTNNSNGLKSAISLQRLDSDVSYKSGNELTLRPFKSIKTFSTAENSSLCSYLETEDISDGSQKSYFRSDGIKITSGESIETITLYKKNDSKTKYVYFYNIDEQKIISTAGELVANNITERFRITADSWQYVLCSNANPEELYAVVFSPEKIFTLSAENYALDTVTAFEEYITVKKKTSDVTDVIGIGGITLGTYTSVYFNGSILTAANTDGSYSYIGSDGTPIMHGAYGDMQPIEALSCDSCTVFSSESYNSNNKSVYYHFARGSSALYSVDIADFEIELLDSDTASYLLKKSVDGKMRYTFLAPFSSAKLSRSYDAYSLNRHNGVTWLLAESYSEGIIDIVDTTTAKAVFSLSVSDEDFAKYSFSHVDNVALATDGLDTDTAVHISIVKLEKYESDSVLSSTRYYAVYRSAPSSSEKYCEAVLNVLELGSDLLLKEPYKAYTAENYLIVHSSSGSDVFSLSESFVLSDIASVPYRIERIISDGADIEKDYFVVKTDSGTEGLYNTDSECVLTPYYGRITAIEDKYIVVKLSGAYGVIVAKSNGKTKTVIDFMYSKITPIGDNGYYAITGEGHVDIYNKDVKVLSKSIQSHQTISAFSDSGDGEIALSYWHVFSADAKLYVHRSEQKAKLTFSEYKVPEVTDAEILNKRSTVIYYYSDTALLHTQVIHPTEGTGDILSSLYMAEDKKIWHTSGNAGSQVTAEYFQDKHIIKLYGSN